jgi:hypothetical protein
MGDIHVQLQNAKQHLGVIALLIIAVYLVIVAVQVSTDGQRVVFSIVSHDAIWPDYITPEQSVP